MPGKERCPLAGGPVLNVAMIAVPISENCFVGTAQFSYAEDRHGHVRLLKYRGALVTFLGREMDLFLTKILDLALVGKH